MTSGIHDQTVDIKAINRRILSHGQTCKGTTSSSSGASSGRLSTSRVSAWPMRSYRPILMTGRAERPASTLHHFARRTSPS